MASRSGGAGMPAELCAPCVADWAADAPFLGCVGCSRCPRRGSCRLIPSPFRLVVGGAEEGFLQLDGNGDTEQDDALYDEAVQFVLESRRASISSVQRKLRVGYNRAARLIEAMEAAGVVSAMNSNGSREILVPDRK